MLIVLIYYIICLRSDAFGRDYLLEPIVVRGRRAAAYIG